MIGRCTCGGLCESPLECSFWHFMRKTPLGERGVQQQAAIGPYRVDCLCDCDGASVVVELDGAEFHQDQLADLRREDFILQTVDAVIRIPYAAMHFYPHATFCVLGKFYRRFELRAVDIFCIPVCELRHEMSEGVTANGDFTSEAAWLEWAEPNFELWGTLPELGVGWVGSPKAWLKRWDIKPITLRRKGHRPPQVSRKPSKELVPYRQEF